MKCVCIALLISFTALSAWAQDFEAGMAAYDRGDYAAALKEWRPLAEQGDASAQNNLGVMYDAGIGVPQDSVEAVRWYRLAAKQGLPDAQLNVALKYYHGEGVPQNYKEANRWFHMAAEQGDAEAQFRLGLGYVKGQGVRQDYAEAVRWLRMAADQDEPNAQVALGVMYDNGTGVPKNYSKAIRLYRLAAEQGLAVAQYNIGDMYYSGRGVAQNYAEAARWFSMAADQGDADAQVSLGTMYAEGLGVQQNSNEAIRLFGLAAAQGNTVAQHRLAKGFDYPSAAAGGDVKRQEIDPFPSQIEEDITLVRQVQKALAAIGYYDGPIDGIAGPLTRAGVMSFQQNAGIPVTGNVSKELIGQLELVLAAIMSAQRSTERSEQAAESSGPSESQKPIETSEAVSTGTGFFVDDEGRILTNRHVVEACETIKIAHSSRTTTSVSVQPDIVHDLALIESGIRPRAVAYFRSGRGIRPGDSVYAYGFPLQGLLASDPGITAGNVSNLAGIGNDRSLLQITAPIQSGNSGGPLLDKTGNVVGVIVGKLNSIEVAKLTGDIPQNVNFAINSIEVQEFLDAIGIAYRTAPSQQERDAAEIAVRARRFTVLVECWR